MHQDLVNREGLQREQRREVSRAKAICFLYAFQATEFPATYGKLSWACSAAARGMIAGWVRVPSAIDRITEAQREDRTR